VLAVADGAPPYPFARARRRPLRAAVMALRRLVWHKLGFAFLALFGLLLAGFALLITLGGFSLGNSLYLTFLDPAGAAVTDPALGTAEKVAQFLLTFAGVAFIPVVTAAVVSARLTGSLQPADLRLGDDDLADRVQRNVQHHLAQCLLPCRTRVRRCHAGAPGAAPGRPPCAAHRRYLGRHRVRPGRADGGGCADLRSRHPGRAEPCHRPGAGCRGSDVWYSPAGHGISKPGSPLTRVSRVTFRAGLPLGSRELSVKTEEGPVGPPCTHILPR
jgi:hypothetical protein